MSMKNNCIYFLLIFILSSTINFGCSYDIGDEPIRGSLTPGIALNFDDDFTDEWMTMMPIFEKYNVKATFNVCPKYHNPVTLNETELKELYIRGNEIASHTFNHPNVVKYIQDFGDQKFIENEIQPSINFFKRLGIPVETFAYPGGIRNSHSDSLLLKYYKRVRGAPNDYKGNKLNAPFVLERGNKVLYHFYYFDRISPFTMKKLKQEIIRAKMGHAVLILLGHKPEIITDTDYSFSLQTLDEICSFAAGINMKFYTMSEL